MVQWAAILQMTRRAGRVTHNTPEVQKQAL
jgi:hypothetical protein